MRAKSNHRRDFTSFLHPPFTIIILYEKLGVSVIDLETKRALMVIWVELMPTGTGKVVYCMEGGRCCTRVTILGGFRRCYSMCDRVEEFSLRDHPEN